MNQQQRAGKHPSFSRDRKPPGLTREKFRKGVRGPTVKESRRKIEKNALRRFSHNSSNPNGSFGTLPSKHPDLLDCIKVLEKLSIRPVCDETVSACFIVSGQPPWVRMLCIGRFQRAREDLLRTAVEEAMAARNFELIRLLLPQVLNRKLVLCMLSTAASVLSDPDFLLIVGMVLTGNIRSEDLCIVAAVRHERWSIVWELLKTRQPPQRAMPAVLELEAIQVCLKKNLGKTLLNRALVRAIKSRKWDIKRGTDIADASAEDGLILNDENGRGEAGLHHTIEQRCSVNVVELLLQAGADHRHLINRLREASRQR